MKRWLRVQEHPEPANHQRYKEYRQWLTPIVKQLASRVKLYANRSALLRSGLSITCTTWKAQLALGGPCLGFSSRAMAQKGGIPHQYTPQSQSHASVFGHHLWEGVEYLIHPFIMATSQLTKRLISYKVIKLSVSPILSSFISDSFFSLQ